MLGHWNIEIAIVRELTNPIRPIIQNELVVRKFQPIKIDLIQGPDLEDFIATNF